MVELAFPILVIKTFNNWLLKFIGNLVSVLSVVVPHCIYDEIINHLKELFPRDTLSKSTVKVTLLDVVAITPILLKSVYPFTQSVVNTAKIVEVDIFVFIVILGGLVFCFTTPYPHCRLMNSGEVLTLQKEKLCMHYHLLLMVL